MILIMHVLCTGNKCVAKVNFPLKMFEKDNRGLKVYYYFIIIIMYYFVAEFPRTPVMPPGYNGAVGASRPSPPH